MSKLKLAVNAYDQHIGNVNADIILVEYGDFECSHCRHAHLLVKRLLQHRSNEFYFIFRNFPLREVHRHAYDAAVAAEAAGRQGKFWEMHDLIFEDQDKLNPKFLLSLGKKLGLDMLQFAKDRESKEVQKKVDSDFESGFRSGVNGTPTFFLNGSKLLTYDETYESLLDAVLLESERRQQ